MDLPVALEPIITKTAELAYFTELDNWVGTYLLVIMGLIEIIVAGWLMKDNPLDEINMDLTGKHQNGYIVL